MLLKREDMARQALLMADHVRDKYDIEPEVAINVFDLCGERLDPIVLVRFSDIPSMEGFYLRKEKPEIWIGERPLGRRMFNCAHELGHHLFGHGSSFDDLAAEHDSGQRLTPEEFLVDSFASYLLMPRMAVMYAFSKRGWNIAMADPGQFFVVSCSLGVGFKTLASHCFYALNLIGESSYRSLLKAALPVVRRSMLGDRAPSKLLVIDKNHTILTADTEVGTCVLLPQGVETENNTLANPIDTPCGRLFTAMKPGVTRVYTSDRSWALIVRVMKDKYKGLSRYRHLAQEDGDDE